ncbi:MAG: IMP cyclohydrolase [Candidatus Adiutrix intracellularis]|jgi:phosphoribosylaminoimidazolecarboxamide formyltransferase/IMP cyclohydrolase|nr:IMP cyclohydrolase [Candidatus Adiutrix intracellularis]
MGREQYRQILRDHFPDKISLKIGKTTLVYQKQIYEIKIDPGLETRGGLRYGENPGQEAAIYRLVNGNLALAGVTYVGPADALVSALTNSESANNNIFGCGKHPSKTNLTDVDAALGILRYLTEKPTVVIVKHNNPSGVATGSNIKSAFERAWLADPVASFGGAAVLNRSVNKPCAKAMNNHYLEVVAAPDFEESALGILLQKKDLRIFKIKRIDKLQHLVVKRFLDIKSLIDGGLILQQSAINTINSAIDFIPAVAEHSGRIYQAQRQPTARELNDLVFGWAVEQGVISNSILFVKNEATIAIGAGGQDRVGIVEATVAKAYRNFSENLAQNHYHQSFKELELAVNKGESPRKILEDLNQKTQTAQGGLTGAVMISDAFFPFRDGVDTAINHGIRAIAQPGGALRDYEVIEAVNQARPKVAMVFTGQRAFKH